MLQPFADGFGLFFEPFQLQGGHPGVEGEARQGRDYSVTRWVLIGFQQFAVIGTDRVGTGEEELGDGFAVGAAYLAVDVLGDVQDDGIVDRVGVMSMAVPVGRLLVNFDVAYPKHAVQFELGVEEVGACVGVAQSGVNHFHGLAGGGPQLGEWK